ncbi:MAG: transcriptional repressor [Oscillospiraceae bacterium]|nr:transcriptional repressor [Oscillospiraceae bacterium]
MRGLAARRQSKIRQAIYEAVMQHPIHPTAEWIYKLLKPRYPSLSLGTVYRNLGILAEQGKIRRIPSQDTADHFDGNMKPHFHAQCRICGDLRDVFLPYDPRMDRQAQQTTDFQIEEHSVMFFGVCPVCKKEKEGA